MPDVYYDALHSDKEGTYDVELVLVPFTRYATLSHQLILRRTFRATGRVYDRSLVFLDHSSAVDLYRAFKGAVRLEGQTPSQLSEVPDGN